MRKMIIKVFGWIDRKRILWNGSLRKFRKAVKTADRLAAMPGGRRTYVYFLQGKYRCLNRKQVQELRNAGVFRHDMCVSRMRRVQLYDTQGRANTHPLYKNVEI